MAFSPTIPTIMIPPTKLEMLSVIPVQSEGAEDPGQHRHGDEGGHQGRAPVAELEEQDDRDEQQAAEQDVEQLAEGVLLLLVEAAERDVHAGGQAQAARELAADLPDRAAEVAPLEARGDAEERFQVLAVDLGFGGAGRNRGDVRDRDERAARRAQAQALEPPRIAGEEPDGRRGARRSGRCPRPCPPRRARRRPAGPRSSGRSARRCAGLRGSSRGRRPARGWSGPVPR